MISWSIVHGGPAGNFFSPSLYNAVAYGITEELRVSDIPNPDLRDKVAQVNL